MTGLDAPRRDTLRAVQDWFVTPVDGFPTSAQADPDETVLDLVLHQLEPLLDEVGAALDTVQGDVAAQLSRLRTDDPNGFEVIRLVCLARYLTSPAVWELLGYRGRRPAPIEIGEADVLLDGLLDPPRRRGKVYRPTPAPAPHIEGLCED